MRTGETNQDIRTDFRPRLRTLEGNRRSGEPGWVDRLIQDAANSGALTNSKFASHPGSRCRFEEKRKRLDQVGARLFHGRALTGDVQFRAQGHESVALAFDDRGHLSGAWHASSLTSAPVQSQAILERQSVALINLVCQRDGRPRLRTAGCRVQNAEAKMPQQAISSAVRMPYCAAAHPPARAPRGSIPCVSSDMEAFTRPSR